MPDSRPLPEPTGWAVLDRRGAVDVILFYEPTGPDLERLGYGLLCTVVPLYTLPAAAAHLAADPGVVHRATLAVHALRPFGATDTTEAIARAALAALTPEETRA